MCQLAQSGESSGGMSALSVSVVYLTWFVSWQRRRCEEDDIPNLPVHRNHSGGESESFFDRHRDTHIQ